LLEVKRWREKRGALKTGAVQLLSKMGNRGEDENAHVHKGKTMGLASTGRQKTLGLIQGIPQWASKSRFRGTLKKEKLRSAGSEDCV